MKISRERLRATEIPQKSLTQPHRTATRFSPSAKFILPRRLWTVQPCYMGLGMANVFFEVLVDKDLVAFFGTEIELGIRDRQDDFIHRGR